MMFLLVLVVVLIASVSANSAVAPGKIFLWSPSGSKKTEKHLTASHHVSTAIEHIKNTIGKYEAVVVFNNVVRSTLDNAEVKNAIKNAPFKHIISHVYSEAKNINDNVRENLATESTSIDTVSAVLKDLQANKGKLSNKKPEVYHVTFDPAQHMESFNELEKFASQRDILFIGIDEAHADAAAPRRLKNTNPDPNDSTSIYYKPEGAEYAIYYANTYLYITPDIFTGLMTGLFFVFVLYTGIGCLGSIQGMSSFYEKLPSVGREA